MTSQLNQIASFHSGVYLKTQPEGNTLYLQVSDFDSSGDFRQLATPVLNDSTLKPAALLQEGDILFAGKGTNNFAAVYTSNIPKAVASSTFIVIRLNKDQRVQVLPTFLAWQMNHPAVLDPLRNAAMGSSMPTITMQQLSNVIINIPPLEKQELIVRLHQLHQQEKNLQQQLAQLKETQFQQILINAINPKPNGKKGNTI